MVALGVDIVAGERGAGVRRAPVLSSPRLGFAVAQAEMVSDLVPEWAALADRPAGDNLFFHPDFAVPAMACLGGGVAIATVIDAGGNLAAIAPFTRARLGRIAPVARLWSHDYGPLGLPLINERAIQAAAAALIDGLAPEASGAGLIVPDLPLEGEVATALVAAAGQDGRPVDILDRHARAVIDRPADGSLDLRAALPARRRKEFGRQMRRLGDFGAVSIESISDPEKVTAAFETFMALEAAGWKGRRGTALVCNAATAALGRQAVANRAASGAARIDAIVFDDRPIAMVVSFIAGATAFTWKIAHDETFARFSPGAQLMLDVAASLFSDPSVMRIDSCASADHPMIDHLWPGRMVVGTMVIGPPGGSVVHRIGLAAARAEIAVRAAGRRLRR